MGWSFSFATLELAFGLALLNAGEAFDNLIVRTYDYVSVPKGTLAYARAHVDVLFGRAHLKLQWLDCGPTEAEPKVACEHLPGDSLILKLLPEHMAVRMKLAPDTFGLTIPHYASFVCYERVARMASQEQLHAWRLLGPVIAHEIGHLLLGTEHSYSGLMKNVLNVQDIKDSRPMTFSKAEVRNIRNWLHEPTTPMRLSQPER